LELTSKEEELRKLAEKRKRTRMPGYRTLADYHDGVYECDYVSPWSKSAHNVDAEVMIVGHDWASEKWMAGPVDQDSAQRGYSDRFPTNKNLFDLLTRKLGLSFGDTYTTNAFPFIKRGESQGSVKSKDMQWAAQEFLLPQIKIIQPKIVICLGKATFNAVRGAYGENQKILTLDEAIRTPFSQNPEIRAVAHTGSRMRDRNKIVADQVDRDWTGLRRRLDELRAESHGWACPGHPRL
jgi:restriction system protein